MSTGDDFIASSGINFLVPFLATKEALALLANDPIMLGRSIFLFRHLECQNLSIISDSIGRARIVQHFLRSRRSWIRGGVQLSYGDIFLYCQFLLININNFVLFNINCFIYL